MNRLTRSLLTAAVTAVFASGASAQQRVDRSGATDANNRSGSNGRNDTGPVRSNPWDIQNRIVYGNVTGGKQFRGGVSSTDPQAFRGRTGSTNSDRFVRDSSGVTTGGIATYNANQTRAFYGDSRGVAAPANTVGVRTLPGSTAAVPRAWNISDPRAQAVSGGDTATLNRNGLPGDANTIYAPGAIGVVPATAGVESATSDGALSDYTALNSNTVNQFTPAQIKQAQSDDAQLKIPGQTPANGSTNNIATDPQQLQSTPPGTPSNRVNPPTPANPLQPKPATGELDSSAISNAVTPAGGPDLGTFSRVVPRTDKPVTAAARGTADAAAAAAATADQPKRPGQANEEANRRFNADMRAQKANKSTEGKAADGATAKPDAAGANKPAAPAGPPPKVATFAGDATNQGLTDLMTKAEGQLKEGKYGSAIETYGAAEALAPRNATIKLGRANAELGGAYYRRAEASLRSAFAADKKLLGNQYDLRAFLGDERLQAAQKDLGDLVQNKPTDAGPAVLLAYIYYNTGNERRAAALLDLADKQTGGRDPLVRAMKTTWTYQGADEMK